MANIIDILIQARDMASDQMAKVESASGKLSNSLAPLGRAMEVAGLATAALGVASVKMAADYEQGLNIFKSVSGATAAQMALVSEKARQLGKDAALPGISAADAAGAMTELAKAGLSVNETLAASKGVLSLAKAGQMDVASAATIAASSLNAFKLKGEDAAKVADILAAGANASAADMTGLSQGLAQSAAVAGQFGVSLQDTVATLGLFANRGLAGSDAGTSLKTMLIALANPSKEAADTMKKLGLNAYDAAGNFVGMGKFAVLLQNSLVGLTQEQKNAALATIFGTDAFRAASFLADSAGQKFEDMTVAVGRNGTATELAAAQNSGLNGAIDNLLSTLETMATDLGTKVIPQVTAFVKALTNSGVWNGIVNNIDSIVVALGTMATIFAAVKIITFVQGIMAAITALKLATGATAAFNAVLLANPVVLITVAIIALIGLLVWLQVKFDIFGKTFKFLGDVANTVGNAIGQFAYDAVQWFKGVDKSFNEMVDGIVSGAKQMWQDFVDTMAKAWGSVVGAANDVADAVTGVWNKIADAASKAWNYIYKGAIKPVLDVLTIIMGAYLAYVTYIWQWIAALAALAFNKIAGVVSQVFDAISARAQAVGEFFAGIWSWISERAVAAFEWVGGRISAILGYCVGLLQEFGGFIIGIWNWIAGVATTTFNYIGGVIATVANAAKAPLQAVGNFAIGIWNWISNGANAAFSWVRGIIDTAMGGAKNSAQDFGNFVSGIWNWVINGASALGRTIGNAVSSGMDAMKGAVKGSINWVIDQINGMINAVNGVASKVPGAPKMGNIARLANGTHNWGGGVALVGERGPEMVQLPQGANVYSATRTANALRGGGGGNGGVHIDKLEVNNNVDVALVIREIGWQLSTR